jgi:hypothetical protein
MLIAGGRNQYLAIKEGTLVDVNCEAHCVCRICGVCQLAEQINNSEVLWRIK